jgi:hypothetical protein
MKISIIIGLMVLLLTGCGRNHQAEDAPFQENPTSRQQDYVVAESMIRIEPQLLDYRINFAVYEYSNLVFISSAQNVMMEWRDSEFASMPFSVDANYINDTYRLMERINLSRSDPDMVNVVVASFSQFAQMYALDDSLPLRLVLLLCTPDIGGEFVGLFIRDNLLFEPISNRLVQMFQVNADVPNYYYLRGGLDTVRRALHTALVEVGVADALNITLNAIYPLLITCAQPAYPEFGPLLEVHKFAGDEVVLYADVTVSDSGTLSTRWFELYDSVFEEVGEGMSLTVSRNQPGTYYFYRETTNRIYTLFSGYIFTEPIRSTYPIRVIVTPRIDVETPIIENLNLDILSLWRVDDDGVAADLRLSVDVRPISDGGVLSYRWFVIIERDGYVMPSQQIEGAYSATIDHRVSDAGTIYRFYVVVTNTNVAATGRQSVSVPSVSSVVFILPPPPPPLYPAVIHEEVVLFYHGWRPNYNETGETLAPFREPNAAVRDLENVASFIASNLDSISEIRIIGRFFNYSHFVLGGPPSGDGGLSMRRAEHTRAMLLAQLLALDVNMPSERIVLGVDFSQEFYEYYRHILPREEAQNRQRRTTITVIGPPIY